LDDFSIGGGGELVWLRAFPGSAFCSVTHSPDVDSTTPVSGEPTDSGDRGWIAIESARQDHSRVSRSSDPLPEKRAEAERICGGKPQRPVHRDRPVAIVKWVDGTVLDTVWQVP
jgi:citrate lyase subunit alpha/citrate CoA-transferase